MSKTRQETRCLVGNQRILMVVGKDSNVVWCKSPWLDSSPAFSQMLSEHSGGEFLITPTTAFECKLDWTHDLSRVESTFETVTGKGRVVDEAVILNSGLPTTLFRRRIEILSGRIEWRLLIEPRFEQGHREALLDPLSPFLIFRDSSLVEREWSIADYWIFYWTVMPPSLAHHPSNMINPISYSPSSVRSYSHSFVLNAESPLLSQGAEILWGHGRESKLLLSELHSRKTASGYLRPWVRSLDKSDSPTQDPLDQLFEGPWRPIAQRSLRTLELLTHIENHSLFNPSHEIHHFGSRRPNFRGATPSVRVTDMCRALLLWSRMPDTSKEYARAFRIVQWLIRILERNPPERISASYTLDEEGPAEDSPSRMTLRLDTFGWILHALQVFCQHPPSSGQTTLGSHSDFVRMHWEKISNLTDWLCHAWRRPDLGVRGDASRPTHFTASKAMAWLGIKSALLLAEELKIAPRKKWENERNLLHQTICQQGVHRIENTFTAEFGSSETDLSALLLFLIDFLPISDQRLTCTLERISAQFWYISILNKSGQSRPATDCLNKILEDFPAPHILGEKWIPSTREDSGSWPGVLAHVELLHTLLDMKKPLF